MILIKNLQYKDILSIKNVEIDNNSITYIVGDSGSGKSTLLNIIFGNIYDYSGKVSYNNFDYSCCDFDELRKEVGYLSQSYVFFTNHIEDEFKYIASLLNMEYSREKLNKLLDICLLNANTQIIEKLSGGEKQRLALARLLYTDKKLLLLDEITSSLDENKAVLLTQNLISYSRENEVKLIMISHNEQIVNKYQEQLIRMEEINNVN